MIVEGVTIPKPLEQLNGRVPSELLSRVPIDGVRMYALTPAAFAVGALAAAAPFALSATGCYRTIDEQIALFEVRYQLAPATPWGKRYWNGQTWYRRRGVASAATPGTSVHGWGLAVDFCIAGNVPLDRAAVAWLRANATSRGWAESVQGEPWHFVLVDWARYTPAAPPPPQEDDMPAPRIVIEQGGIAQWFITPALERVWIRDPQHLAELRAMLTDLGHHLPDTPEAVPVTHIYALPVASGTPVP